MRGGRRPAAPDWGLSIRKQPSAIVEAIRGGYLLRFTGREATLARLDPVLDEVEIVCGTT